jgi:hypothetical protein
VTSPAPRVPPRALFTGFCAAVALPPLPGLFKVRSVVIAVVDKSIRVNPPRIVR